MVVLDCCAAMAILEESPIGQALRASMLEGERVVAPTVFVPELGNAHWQTAKAGLLDPVMIEERINEGMDLVDEFVEVKGLIVEATQEALRYNHPVYDMLYLVLTRRNGATLFTLDKKLANICCKAGVNCVELVDWPVQ